MATGEPLVVAGDVPEKALFDGGKTRQILLNVIGNAIKFTERGGVLVTVSRRHGGDRVILRFTVRDTGPGIAPRDLARIFSEFEQAGEDASLRQAGAGLGLAISQRIAEAMGGRMSAASRLGKGSVFAAELPVEVLEVAPAGQPLAGRSVLVLSRNRMESEALVLAIRDQGGSAGFARTVEEAGELGTEDPFDILIVDAALEDDDGSLLRRLRAVCGRQAAAVIFIDPKARGRLGRFRAHGYSHFLPRPLRRNTLLKVLLAKVEETKPPPPPSHPLARTPLNVLIAEDNEVSALLARAAVVPRRWPQTTPKQLGIGEIVATVLLCALLLALP